MSRQGFVYFMRPVGMVSPIKIGFSIHLRERYNQLSVWSPYPLEIIATIPGDLTLETAFHERFAKSHYHHEWFHGHVDLIKGIADLQRGVPYTEAFDLSVREGSIRRGIPYKPSSTRRSRRNARLDQLLGVTGGATGLANALGGITSQAIAQWKKVPANRVLRVEAISGISRHELRPDIYPPPEEAA